MRKNSLIAGVIVTLILLLNSEPVDAQSDASGLELGAQFALMRQRAPGTFGSFSPAPSPWDAGFGGRVGYHVTPGFAFEAEVNVFPRENDFLRRGRKTQGLFGVKAGHRSDKFGIFGKVRPGFMRYSRVFDCPGANSLSCDEFGKTEFALDVGGVVEYYPSRRAILRFDVGDTIIRFGDRTAFPFAPELPDISVRQEGGTAHSFQFNVGIGIRF